MTSTTSRSRRVEVNIARPFGERYALYRVKLDLTREDNFAEVKLIEACPVGFDNGQSIAENSALANLLSNEFAAEFADAGELYVNCLDEAIEATYA